MKKLALVFITAVFVPSLILAGLALRSLRDQQFVLERQQSLLYQGVADALARQADDVLTEQQHQFGQQVEAMLADANGHFNATTFDKKLRAVNPSALVGCVVTTNGDLLSPPPNSQPAATVFYEDFGKFLGNRESVEVYSSSSRLAYNNNGNIAANGSPNQQVQFLNSSPEGDNLLKNGAPMKVVANNYRQVIPQQNPQFSDSQALSKVAPAAAEFRELIGDSSEGTIARFVENKLNVLLWHRSLHATNLIFAAQLSMARLKQALQPVVAQMDPAFTNDITVALLDDTAKPVAVSRAGFTANWKHPFVATEIGEALPHWEMAVYLVDPGKLVRSAQVVKLTLGFLTGVLMLAIALGSGLIIADVNRQLALARQKTDFVSNVSHELKTPLTSIRMFSELLAEGRVTDLQKRQSYLNIITAEASRLTRLINNVLDFSRMERGAKKYDLQPCDLAALVRETVETCRPHLESSGFRVTAHWPDTAIPIKADRDAIAQIIVNLLSNAEKYSGAGRDIVVEIVPPTAASNHAEVRVLDRGAGVPRGCEEKIFEQFYRAHDLLASGIQGSGLGLTLARQIARAHGGDVCHRPRDGGGSCFVVRLPAAKQL